MNSDQNLKNQPDSYWREKLTPEQYHELREKGTESPYCGVFYLHDEPGVYTCAACDEELFSSDTKYHDDFSGWPSFKGAVDSHKIELLSDESHGMFRTEVLCHTCGSHLGHVFNDGPPPTHEHYCINSIALNFKPHKKQ